MLQSDYCAEYDANLESQALELMRGWVVGGNWAPATQPAHRWSIKASTTACYALCHTPLTLLQAANTVLTCNR